MCDVLFSFTIKAYLLLCRLPHIREQKVPFYIAKGHLLQYF